MFTRSSLIALGGLISGFFVICGGYVRAPAPKSPEGDFLRPQRKLFEAFSFEIISRINGLRCSNHFKKLLASCTIAKYSLFLAPCSLLLAFNACAQSPSNSQAFEHQKTVVSPGAWSTDLYLPMLEGKRVGLVVNQTSTIGKTHLIDTLVSLGVHVVKIFAPEHGLRGTADAGEEIGDSIDAKTGIPIISLYGNKKTPSHNDLFDLDLVVFDIQDVGVRFYTYINTLQYLMQALATAHMPLILLDRPNPNGHYIDGPVLDFKYRSFVGLDPIPVVYGMTIGEFGQMINGEGWLLDSCYLTVIPCKGYDHNTMYDLPIKPSPNLPNLRSILLYPGLCFFEGTDVSIGRGTDNQFQVAGSPVYPDKKFSFTPKAMPGATNPPLKDKKCYGVDLTKASVDSLFALRHLDLSVLLRFYSRMDTSTFFNASWFDKLAGGPSFREAIQRGESEEQIREGWKADIDKFRERRKRYLLYKDFD